MSQTPEAAYFRRETFAELDSPEFWTALNPGLSISRRPLEGLKPPYPAKQSVSAQIVDQVCNEGYFQTDPVIDLADCQVLVQALHNIIQAGLHPLFLSVYDQYWQVINRLSAVLEPVLGPGCYPLADFWIWCISPKTASVGWPPHRDLQFPPPTLREDSRPKIVTVWIPFTDSTPLNGCIYILPMDRDANVDARDFQNYSFSNLQDVRALPARAGSVLGWNQYLLHWGSRSSAWAEAPRINTGIYFQSADAPPFLNKVVDFGAGFELNQRLGYISSALLNYHQYHAYPPQVLDFCFEHLRVLENYQRLLPPGMVDPLPA